MFIHQDRTSSEKNQIISLKDLMSTLYHKTTKKSINKKNTFLETAIQHNG